MMATTTGLRQRKKERTARAIMDAVLESIRGQGYEHTTVEEIVSMVEVSQPTFYNYFGSLDDVLARIATEIMDDWAREAHSKALPRASVRGILRARYRALAQAITEDPTLWRAIFMADALNPYRKPEQRHPDLAMEKIQQASIERGRKNGEINRSYSAVFLSRNLDAMQFSIAMDWCMGDQKESLRTRLDRGLDLFLRGAGTP